MLDHSVITFKQVLLSFRQNLILSFVLPMTPSTSFNSANLLTCTHAKSALCLWSPTLRPVIRIIMRKVSMIDSRILHSNCPLKDHPIVLAPMMRLIMVTKLRIMMYLCESRSGSRRRRCVLWDSSPVAVPLPLNLTAALAAVQAALAIQNWALREHWEHPHPLTWPPQINRPQTPKDCGTHSSGWSRHSCLWDQHRCQWEATNCC